MQWVQHTTALVLHHSRPAGGVATVSPAHHSASAASQQTSSWNGYIESSTPQRWCCITADQLVEWLQWVHHTKAMVIHHSRPAGWVATVSPAHHSAGAASQQTSRWNGYRESSTPQRWCCITAEQLVEWLQWVHHTKALVLHHNRPAGWVAAAWVQPTKALVLKHSRPAGGVAAVSPAHHPKRWCCITADQLVKWLQWVQHTKALGVLATAYSEYFQGNNTYTELRIYQK